MRNTLPVAFVSEYGNIKHCRAIARTNALTIAIFLRFPLSLFKIPYSFNFLIVFAIATIITTIKTDFRKRLI